MSFTCPYCHVNYDEKAILHRVPSVYIDCHILSLCDYCFLRTYLPLKKEQEEKARQSSKCENKDCRKDRYDKYKYCLGCYTGIVAAIKSVKEFESKQKQILSDCNKMYNTNLFILVSHWDPYI